MTDDIKSGQASRTVDLLLKGENKRLLSLIPKGQSPKLYLDLIKEHLMGQDKLGHPRRDEDLLLFLYVAKRTGLDPLTRQIYAVFRWNTRFGREVMSIQTGIDGMRLVAQRSETYAGQDDIKFVPEDESALYPIKASCTVYKVIMNTRVGFTGTARWNEYVQKDGKGQLSTMWQKMPYTMLGKCAEALALRKGFPNELSGIYAEEEMQQANNVLAGIKAPEKFEKEGKIEVLHGKPDRIENKAVVGTEEALKVSDKKKAEVKNEKVKKVEEVRPDLKAIREKLKKMGKKASA